MDSLLNHKYECISDYISFSRMVDGLNVNFMFCASFAVYFACLGRNVIPNIITLFLIFFKSLTFKYPYVWCYVIKSLSRFSLVRIACSCFIIYNVQIVIFYRGKSNQDVGHINRRMMFPKRYNISIIINFRYGPKITS